MNDLEIHSFENHSSIKIPLSASSVKAGFPSPADDYPHDPIDLNRELIRHPESSFFVRVAGDSMIDADLEQGDLLLVDKSIYAKSGDIAVCVLNNEFTVKQVYFFDDHVELRPANDAYKTIRVNPYDDFSVWGIVTYVIKKVYQ